MLHVWNLSDPVTLKVLSSSPGIPRKTKKCSFALMRTKLKHWIFYEHQPLPVTPEAPCKSVVIFCGDNVDLCGFSAAGPGRIVKTEHEWSEPKWSSLNENIYFEKDHTKVSSFRPSPMWVASDAGRVLVCLHEAWGKFLCVARPLCPSPSREALLI